MAISKTIKDIRKSHNLSQEAFAKKLGVSFSTVNRWENGKSKPNYEAMQRIVRFCGDKELLTFESKGIGL